MLAAPRRRLILLTVVGIGVPLLAIGAFVMLRGDPPADPPAALEMHPVAGSFAPDDTTLDDCTGRDDEAQCLEQAFGNVSYNDGPKAALAIFDRRIAKPGPAESNCHRIVHSIGSAALARYDGDVGQAFSQGSASCWSGYYHGILERALLGANTDAALRRAVRSVCGGDPRERDPLHRLPVRPRARARPHDQHRPRPHALPFRLREPRDDLGADVV